MSCGKFSTMRQSVEDSSHCYFGLGLEATYSHSNRNAGTPNFLREHRNLEACLSFVGLANRESVSTRSSSLLKNLASGKGW
jgi:hypothetical protein